MRELRHAEAGRSQVTRPERRESSRIAALVIPASTSGAQHLVKFRGSLAGPIISQIVDVHAINNMCDPALTRDLVQPREQLILAVEAAVAVVLEVVGILKFQRGDVFMPDAPGPCEFLRIALVRFGQGSGIGGQRQGAIPRACCAAQAR